MLSQNKRGFTLVELIVVMAIFMVIIMITAAAFKTIVDNSSQQTKSIETQIEGIVGLEVLRADLQQIGFGLPWTFSHTLAYEEAVQTNYSTTTAADPLLNDKPDKAPRAILSEVTTFNGGSMCLVVKSTLTAANDTSKKWTTVSYDKDSEKHVRQWGAADRDFDSAERVIVVKNSLMTTPPTRQLMSTSSTVFSATFGTYSTVGLVNPHQNGDTFEVYGVSPSTPLRMPFNRADYYVKRPTANMPTNCAGNTGILYKSIISHSDGKPATVMPLLDCVADMQVVYGLDTSGDGPVNSHEPIPFPTADFVRNQVREIRVYILAQEGKKDLSYRYPSESIRVGEVINGISRGREFNLLTLIGSDYKYYRWKVYTIVVRPKNLIQ